MSVRKIFISLINDQQRGSECNVMFSKDVQAGAVTGKQHQSCLKEVLSLVIKCLRVISEGLNTHEQEAWCCPPWCLR